LEGNRLNIKDLFSLEGRIALVTGGSAGIGKSIAAAFVSAGAKVYISSRKADICEQVAAELGENCKALPQDISSLSGCEELAQKFTGLESRLDILVNNAGVAWGENFETFPEQGWDKVMDLNLKSPFFLTQKLHPLLLKAAEERGPAKVINIASIDGLRLNAWETYSYHASKAGIIHLTARMAARLVRDGINVTAIAPGAFASNMNRAARDRSEAVSDAIPVKRIGGPEDIGAAAIYLAARSGDYVVGETVVVDGGLVHAELGASIDG
jgi:NAD(P)-dependent dehydrogenase (short-subunit alcohol dehydrogenase family)